VTVTTFMVLGGVLIAFMVAVMPAALASGTPSTVTAEPTADPAPTTVDSTESPEPSPRGQETDTTRIAAVAALAAVVLAGVGFWLLRKRRRTPA
jgi:LPXTG-motif cell wall-anchored protein